MCFNLDFSECQINCTYGTALQTVGGIKTASPMLLCGIEESMKAGKDIWKPHEIRDCERMYLLYTCSRIALQNASNNNERK